MAQILNVIKKCPKKELLSHYCQIENTDAQKINEHNLETNTAQDTEICSSGNKALTSLTCVMFLVGPFSSDLIRCIIPNSMDIYLSMDSYHLRRFWYPLESSALLDRDLSVSF